jgi:hypothetical protein
MSSSTGAGRRYLAVYVVAVLASLGFALALNPFPTGDEPHYLLYGLSIAQDHDLDLADEYGSPATISDVYPRDTIETATHAAEFVRGGPLRSLHSPLLPAIIAPVLATGARWLGVRIVLGLLTSLSIPVLLSVLDVLGGRRRRHVALALLASACLPFVCYTTQIFPDALAGLGVVVGIRACLTGPHHRPWLAGGILAAMALPWLQPRYVPLSLGITAALLLVETRPWDRRGTSARSWMPRIKAALPVGAPVLMSLVALLAFNAHIYGQASFTAAYQNFDAPHSEISPRNFFLYSFGDLLSRHYGVLVIAPVLLIGIVGVGAALRRWPLPMLGAITVAAAYYLPTTMIGLWGGYCPPGRYAVPLILPLMIPAAVLLSRPIWRLAAVILGGLSLAVAVATALGPLSSLYPDDTPQWRLPVATSYARLFPTALRPQFPNQATLTPDRLFGHLGRLVDVHGVSARSVRPEDGAEGHLTFGPYLTLRPGSYVASFDVEVNRGRLRLDVAAGGRTLGATDVAPMTRRIVSVPFSLLPGDRGLETRAYVVIPSSAALFGVAINQTAPSPVHSAFPSWLAPIVWSVALIILAVGAFRRPFRVRTAPAEVGVNSRPADELDHARIP